MIPGPQNRPLIQFQPYRVAYITSPLTPYPHEIVDEPHVFCQSFSNQIKVFTCDIRPNLVDYLEMELEQPLPQVHLLLIGGTDAVGPCHVAMIALVGEGKVHHHEVACFQPSR